MATKNALRGEIFTLKTQIKDLLQIVAATNAENLELHEVHQANEELGREVVLLRAENGRLRSEYKSFIDSIKWWKEELDG